MAQQVRIRNGRYSTGRDSYREIHNVVFPLVDGVLRPSDRGTYLTVDGNPVRGYPKRNFKVFVNAGEFEVSGEAPLIAENTEPYVFAPMEPIKLRGEDDQDVKDKIARRFAIVSKLVRAAVEGKARGIVVSGPAGVGKSHEVRDSLERSFEELVGEIPDLDAPVLEVSEVDETEGDGESDDDTPKAPAPKEATPEYRFVTGHCAPMALYQLMYMHRAEKSVLVLDDCDSVLYNDKSLNILKAAMNNKGTRVIDWGSKAVEAVGLPTSFTFKGSIIMITNLDFDHPKFKNNSLGEHLKAIISRVFYVDIGVKTMRECFLRIEQVCRDGQLLTKMGLSDEESSEVFQYFEENITKFRELSIRTAEKLADAYMIDREGWKELASTSTFLPEYQ